VTDPLATIGGANAQVHDAVHWSFEAIGESDPAGGARYILTGYRDGHDERLPALAAPVTVGAIGTVDGRQETTAHA
jgi:hypothetical protein